MSGIIKVHCKGNVISKKPWIKFWSWRETSITKISERILSLNPLTAANKVLNWELAWIIILKDQHCLIMVEMMLNDAIS